MAACPDAARRGRLCHGRSDRAWPHGSRQFSGERRSRLRSCSLAFDHRGAPSPAAQAASWSAVSRDRRGWRLRLHAGSAPLEATVSADARLLIRSASGALRPGLRHSRRRISLTLSAGPGTRELRFTAGCATRIAFTFSSQAVLLGAGAAPAASFTLRRPASTGVAGRMIAGPTCPVVRPGCPPARAVPGTVEISAAPSTRSSGSGMPVKTLSTDAGGAFATDLAPGDYTLVGRPSGTQPPTPSGSSTSRPELVHVASGVVTEVTLTFDTGIR